MARTASLSIGRAPGSIRLHDVVDYLAARRGGIIVREEHRDRVGAGRLLRGDREEPDTAGEPLCSERDGLGLHQIGDEASGRPGIARLGRSVVGVLLERPIADKGGDRRIDVPRDRKSPHMPGLPDDARQCRYPP
jgi:hypothetical protein